MALTLKNWGVEHKVTLAKMQYPNGRLAVQMWAWDDGFAEPYMTVTTNLPDEAITNERCAYIDTNNNGSGIVGWLLENGLGDCTGAVGRSGYCCYPEFEFDMDALAAAANLD